MGRDDPLKPFGWSQEDTEWVAMVCLNSGMFTRTQYADYFNVHRSQATRFVQSLVDLGLAVDEAILSSAPGTARASAGSPTRASTGSWGFPTSGTEETQLCPSISGGSCRSIT